MLRRGAREGPIDLQDVRPDGKDSVAGSFSSAGNPFGQDARLGVVDRRSPIIIDDRRLNMLLQNKTAIIYGAAGAVGSAIARGFAAEGASVFLAGRRLAAVEAAAKSIVASGGKAEAAAVDALDEAAVEAHLAEVAGKTESIDVSFNAIGIPQAGIQGIALADLPVESFMLPVTTYARAQFLTARAAGRRMARHGRGVILMHTPEPARLGATFVGGMGPAWAGMESLSRALSAEFGRQGVRAVVLRSTGLPETATIDLVFDLHARAMGITRHEFRTMVESMTHRGRSTTLDELANAAAFLASDRASAITGTVANLTAGLIVD
jgi:NAD(P)-dependent dehydrogenase (short-subunit alcohol dehydrogenase family)